MIVFLSFTVSPLDWALVSCNWPLLLSAFYLRRSLPLDLVKRSFSKASVKGQAKPSCALMDQRMGRWVRAWEDGSRDGKMDKSMGRWIKGGKDG